MKLSWFILGIGALVVVSQAIAMDAAIKSQAIQARQFEVKNPLPKV